MKFRKFETDRYCVGGRQIYSTLKIYGDITRNGSKVLFGFCSICNRKKSMTANDKTIKADGLGDFFETLGEKDNNVSKKMARNVLKNPSRALDITANIATEATYRNPTNVMSTLPELKTFYNSGK